jgi:hypothetical protein
LNISLIKGVPLNTEGFYKSDYMRGLDSQREKFKAAKIAGNFDAMADSLENLKSEIKNKVISKGRRESMEKIEKILEWYRNKERRYIKKTPNGLQVMFPMDMPLRINHNLTYCYELIVTELDILNLL